MDKIILIYTDTINDIEINGFKVMTGEHYEEYEKLAETITWPFVYKIGELEIEFNSGEDLLSRMEIRDISWDEERTLKRLFTGYGNEFGLFIGENFLKEVIGEEDELDDEDSLDNESYYDDEDKDEDEDDY